ncbi:MAG: ROK family protein, partial [Phycisphaerae bacterium]|nr:ROK family protein [Phycisphaerae bacterium]
DAERTVGVACTVGVGAPGSPNPTTGLHRNSNVVSMNGRPFQADVCAALGKAVRVSNDANCMALSEAVDGAAKGEPTVFGVIIGTGVGGGVVIHQRIVAGHQGIAGEWGHNPMPAGCDGADAMGEQTECNAACYCGRRGCIEQYLCGSALELRYRRLAGGGAGEQALGRQAALVRAGDLAALAARGDLHARATLEWYARTLACALGTIVNVLDPDTIVLAGGLSNIPELHVAVQRHLPPFVFSDACTTRVVRASHGDSSGVRGAAWLGRSGD